MDGLVLVEAAQQNDSYGWEAVVDSDSSTPTVWGCGDQCYSGAQVLKLLTWYAVWVALCIYLGALFFGVDAGRADPFLVAVTGLIALAVVWRCNRCGYPICLDYHGDLRLGSWGLMLPQLPLGECKRCGCSYTERHCGGVVDKRRADITSPTEIGSPDDR